MKLFFVAIFLSLHFGCHTVKEKPDDSELAGTYHRIQAGDTIAKLAKIYRLSEEEIRETNGIEEKNKPGIGQILFMPDPDPITQKIELLVKEKARANRAKPVQPAPRQIFEFPVPDGIILYRFSKAKSRPYDGIGIKAPIGAKVIAPLSGRVLFVGNDGTKFGLMVILEHEDLFITVYAHLHKAAVKTGQLIKQGQLLAYVGASGGIEKPHLHFQIRVNKRPQDPIIYLKKWH